MREGTGRWCRLASVVAHTSNYSQLIARNETAKINDFVDDEFRMKKNEKRVVYERLSHWVMAISIEIARIFPWRCHHRLNINKLTAIFPRLWSLLPYAVDVHTDAFRSRTPYTGLCHPMYNAVVPVPMCALCSGNRINAAQYYRMALAIIIVLFYSCALCPSR